MEPKGTTASVVDVLIAEDDGPTRRALCRLLESAGYTTAEAADGREAVELARRRRPRCVFLDLIMPGLDGLAVARTLRQDPRTRGAHIHCLTGQTDPACREQALRAGCETYLTKPVDVEELLEVIHREVPRTPEWMTGLGRDEAEDLLDWLEQQGCTQLEVDLRDDGWAVGCACPPGLHLGRNARGEVTLLPD
jgi:CheY-like chemotaxis protein